MRITVDISKVLYRKLKSRAAREGTSVTKLVLHGIHAEMERCGNASRSWPTSDVFKSRQPFADKIFPGGGDITTDFQWRDHCNL